MRLAIPLLLLFALLSGCSFGEWGIPKWGFKKKPPLTTPEEEQREAEEISRWLSTNQQFRQKFLR